MFHKSTDKNLSKKVTTTTVPSHKTIPPTADHQYDQIEEPTTESIITRNYGTAKVLLVSLTGDCTNMSEKKIVKIETFQGQIAHNRIPNC